MLCMYHVTIILKNKILLRINSFYQKKHHIFLNPIVKFVAKLLFHLHPEFSILLYICQCYITEMFRSIECVNICLVVSAVFWFRNSNTSIRCRLKNLITLINNPILKDVFLNKFRFYFHCHFYFRLFM